MRLIAYVLLLLACTVDIVLAGEAETELFKAVRENNIEAVKKLMEGKDKPSQTANKYDDTPLGYAVAHNYYDIAELLLNNGVTAKQLKKSDPPVILCAKDKKMIELLLKHGATVNDQQEFGLTDCIALGMPDTLLQQFVRDSSEKSSEMIRFLLDKGADPNAKTRHGETTLELAISKWHVTCRDYEADELKKHLKNLKMLIDAGAKVNETGWETKTALFHAEKIAVMKLLIDAGADVNAVDYENSTPLIYVLKAVASWIHKDNETYIQGKQEIVPEQVELLLKSGANVNIADKWGRTALFYAVQNQYEKAVELLIKAGADVSHPDNSSLYPLNHAIGINNDKIIDMLKNAGAKVSESAVSAICQKDTAMLRRALKGKNDANREYNTEFKISYDNENYVQDTTYLLPVAIQAKNREAIDLLLTYELDAKHNELAIETAMSMDDMETLKKIIGRQSIEKNILTSLAENKVRKIEFLKYLIEKGATPNPQLLLYHALSQVNDVLNKEIAEYALANGADINKKYYDFGRHPLHEAVSFSKHNLLDFLLAHGADVNMRDKHGETPIFSLASTYVEYTEKQIKTLDVLLKHGADINAVDAFGRTVLFTIEGSSNEKPLSLNDIEPPMMLSDAPKTKINFTEELKKRGAKTIPPSDLINAIFQGNEEAAKKFLPLTQDINARKSGLTALEIAIAQDNLPMVKMLIEAGANVNTKNETGETPLLIADHKLSKNLPMVRYLLEHGANVNAVNKRGQNLAMRSASLPTMHGSPESELLETLEMALEFETDLTIKDKEGNTLADYIKRKDSKDFEAVYLQATKKSASSKDKPSNEKAE